MAIGAIGFVIALVGWVIGIVSFLSRIASNLPVIGSMFPNLSAAEGPVIPLGSNSKGPMFVKWDDIFLVTGGVMMLIGALKIKGRPGVRIVFAIGGFLSVAGGITGPTTGWD